MRCHLYYRFKSYVIEENIFSKSLFDVFKEKENLKRVIKEASYKREIEYKIRKKMLMFLKDAFCYKRRQSIIYDFFREKAFYYNERLIYFEICVIYLQKTLNKR